MSANHDVIRTMPLDGREESWMEWFEGLSDAERMEVRGLAEVLPRVGPIEGPQQQAFISEAHTLGYGGAAGGGKAQPLDEMIQTPNGPTPLAEIGIGSTICDPFGGKQQVVGTQHFNDWPVRIVKLWDGTEIRCSPEHLWTGVIQSTRDGANAEIDLHNVASHGVTLETDKLAEYGRSFKLPLCQPSFGAGRARGNGYIAGAWLMAGRMPRGGKPRLVVKSNRYRVLDRLMDVEVEGTRQHLDDDHHIFYPEGEQLDALMEMVLEDEEGWYLSPEAMSAPAHWRRTMLKGIIDAACTQGNSPKSHVLSMDPNAAGEARVLTQVRYLCQSLGMPVSSFWPHLAGNPEYDQKRQSLHHIMFHDIHDMAADDSEKTFWRAVHEVIDPGERCEMKCLQVSHPSGLYLTTGHTITHNSALIALLAILSHHRTVIFRYDATQLRALVDDVVEFVGTHNGLNRQNSVFYFGDKKGHMMEWGGIGKPGSEMVWRGRPHDLLAADEVTELDPKKLMFLKTWLRLGATADRSQRARIIYTFNPPGTIDDVTGDIPTGRWVIPFFAPWVDNRHPNPALPGEIRYYLTNQNGESEEVDSPDPVEMKFKDEVFVVTPESRTFIPARATDNPYLGETYIQNLLDLEEPLRSQMLRGEFQAAISDHPQQIIPTDWVTEAMDRWTEEGVRTKMHALGVDVARGGTAKTVIAPRHGLWWGTLLRTPGSATPSGGEVARLCVQALKSSESAWINVDATGVGSAAYDAMISANMRVHGVMASERKGLRMLPGRLKLYNRRTWLYWLMRLILDPERDLKPQLPPDDQLLEDLTTPMWSWVQGGRILAESKDDIRKRLRRSTDDGDAVLLSLYNFFDDRDLSARLQARVNSPRMATWNEYGGSDFDPFLAAAGGRREDLNWMGM